MSGEGSQKLLVKIVNVDYYLSKPIPKLNDPCYSGFRSLPISYVPVIRVFGPTSTGVKTCVHIHGVFPYIFVPNWNFSIGEKDFYQFAVILDKAINTSFANSSAKACHVYRVTAVLGRPFYGFYEDEKQFLKIEFFNPAIVKRAADLLQNGAVFGTAFQPYEAHVPYILQFFIDNNLYGMNYVTLSSYTTRSDESTTVVSHEDPIKQSHCAIEIDATVNDIVSLQQSMENMPNNPGLAFIWEEEKQRRRIHNQSSQIALSLSQDRPVRFPTRTESYFGAKMAEKLHPHKNVLFPSPPPSAQQLTESELENESLNTQSRSVLSLLEKLIQEKEDKSPSSCSSPSVVCSDDEQDVLVESSQPILKLQAENDSIFGDQFSDTEIDDFDHFVLSQSIARPDYEKLSSSDESNSGSYSNIPQLDGASSPKLSRRRNSKTEAGTRRGYNLRSREEYPEVRSIQRSSPIGMLDSKSPSRKQYPQLQINTQKSPRCAVDQRLPRNKHLTLIGISPTASHLSANVAPGTSFFDDDNRGELRRSYPQLGVSIKKSPKATMTEEHRKASTRLRKRKINFNDQDTSPCKGSFDMSSVTVRWKKQRLKLDTVVEEPSNSVCGIDSDLNSQKYSLKIHFNSDELAEKLYSDVLLRKPVIMLKRMSFDQENAVKENENSGLKSAISVNDDINELNREVNITSERENCEIQTDLLRDSCAIEKNPLSDPDIPRPRKRLGMRMNAQRCTGSSAASTCEGQNESEKYSRINEEVIQGNKFDVNKTKKVADVLRNVDRIETSKDFEVLENDVKDDQKITKMSSDEHFPKRVPLKNKKVIRKKQCSKNFKKSDNMRKLPSCFIDEKITEMSTDVENVSAGSEILCCDELDGILAKTGHQKSITGTKRSNSDKSITKITSDGVVAKTNSWYVHIDVDYHTPAGPLNSNVIGEFKTANDNDSSDYQKKSNMIDKSGSENGDGAVAKVDANGYSEINSPKNLSDYATRRNSQNKSVLVDNSCCMSDEEIDKIARSILQQTMNIWEPSFNESQIKFTEISSFERVLDGEILPDGVELKEVLADRELTGKNIGQSSSSIEIENYHTNKATGSTENEEIKFGKFLSNKDGLSKSNMVTDKSVGAADEIKFTEIDCDEHVLCNDNLTSSKSILNTIASGSNEICVSDFDDCDSNERTEIKRNEVSVKIASAEFTATADNLRRSCDENICERDSRFVRTVHHEPTDLVEYESDKNASNDTDDPIKLAAAEGSDRAATSTSVDGRGSRRNESQNPRNFRSRRSVMFANDVVNASNRLSNCEAGSTSVDTDILATTSDFNTQELFSQSSLDKVAVSTSQSSRDSQRLSRGDRNSDDVEIFSERNSPVLSCEDGVPSCANSGAEDRPCDARRASKANFQFDNSIWYSSDDDVDVDRVCSVYRDESVSSAEITACRDGPCGDDDDTPRNTSCRRRSNCDEESSQRVRSLGSDGPLSSSQSPASAPHATEGLLSDDSPLGGQESRRLLHSTPMQRRLKKSPSPNYTPIHRRLMSKFVVGEERNARRPESALEDIVEEIEGKSSNVSSASTDNAATLKTANDLSKSSNNSRAIVSVGSGRIDVTMNDTYGFKNAVENLQDVKADVQFQLITVMSMELFVETRQNLNPDPEFDAISCVFYSVFHDIPEARGLSSGMIIVDTDFSKLDLERFSCPKHFVRSEGELFDFFVEIIRKYDPDILLGYEIEMLSWGYLIQRGQYLNRNCCLELSRMKESNTRDFKDKSVVEDGDYSNEFKLPGRIVLNVWRLMRHEIALQSYTFENILFHVTHQRIAQYSFRTLTQWWKNALQRWLVVDYYLFRAESSLLLLKQLDFFGRTSELAKLFGIQFYEVLSRGSQFRVESMMLRLAKTQNFVAMSPSPRQRAKMRAPESLPLIMEPESKYYGEPVIVLDFQSLYPSIIIAYNYCFSTCLGRVQHLVNNETFEFGCAQLTVPVDLLLKLESSLNISPCGVAFVNHGVRRGILPAMLEEILETRLIVKKSMKQNKDNSVLQKVLHARQLGLKLIANVTYGYTSANFSGRMPCIEVGDSVVSKGRETLERAIEMISANEKWQAKVIYGDTDSIFVMVPGRSKEEAFQIGSEIVTAVTDDNPKPVKLKLEKVYFPCILQTKKRYVGYMYESADQKEPVYDAKGIETVRRDGCPAVAKILEKSLRLLFETNDVNTVKNFVQRQFSKLISGRLSIQELTFAREYRGMSNYKPAACVPALQLAKQALLKDRRAEPRVKERVRYVLTAGPPGVPLIRLVRTPEQFLDTPGCLINAEYYITRAIVPALERCFALMNVNVLSWYVDLPRKKQLRLPVQNDMRSNLKKKRTIFQYFASSKCISCGDVTISSVCKLCEKKPQQLAVVLGNLINSWQRKYNYISKICRSCSSHNFSIECSSLDCPVYYVRRQSHRDMEQVPFVEELQQKYLRLNKPNAQSKLQKKQECA